MDEINDQKQLLNDTLKVGAFYQTLLLMVEQSFVWEKEDTITSLAEVLAKFTSSLSEEEQKEFKEKLDQVFDSKGEAYADELAKTFSPEELDEVNKDLEELSPVASDAPQTQE